MAWAKAHPDKSNYGTSSPSFTIASELLKLKTGMPGVGIPSKAPMSRICSWLANSACSPFPTVRGDPAGEKRQDARSGGHRLERSPKLPDVPSIAEAGYPEINTHLWSGFFVPAGTPGADMVAKLTTKSSAVRSPTRLCPRRA